MTSFASKVKNELVHVIGDDLCCKRAETAGLLRMSATISFNHQHDFGIYFESENASVARKLFSLLKEEAPDLRVEVTVRRSKRLRKHNNYIVRVVPSSSTNYILEDLGFLSPRNLIDARNDKSILINNCCIISYLRGAFLAGGSVNSPDGQYHLEMVTNNRRFAQLLLELLQRLYLSAKMTERKNDYVVYIKESESILELLSLLGISDELIEFFESARNLKEIRNQVNRLVNCETANLQKTVVASARQVKIIMDLQKTPGWEQLTPKLRETALLRLEHPDSSVTELSQLAHCSRSAMNHRLRKIEEIALSYLEV